MRTVVFNHFIHLIIVMYTLYGIEPWTSNLIIIYQHIFILILLPYYKL